MLMEQIKIHSTNGHAAIVEISESNGATEVVTDGITTSDMGSIDAANLDPVANPVIAGNSTYEKWQRVDVTDLGGSSEINNLQVWRVGVLGGLATHLTNALTASYVATTAYVAPVSTASTIALTAMPTAAPSSANLGIGGLLTGSLTAIGYSDYLVHQINTDATDTAGSTSTMNYQYDEIA